MNYHERRYRAANRAAWALHRGPFDRDREAIDGLYFRAERVFRARGQWVADYIGEDGGRYVSVRVQTDGYGPTEVKRRLQASADKLRRLADELSYFVAFDCEGGCGRKRKPGGLRRCASCAAERAAMIREERRDRYGDAGLPADLSAYRV